MWQQKAEVGAKAFSTVGDAPLYQATSLSANAVFSESLCAESDLCMFILSSSLDQDAIRVSIFLPASLILSLGQLMLLMVYH